MDMNSIDPSMITLMDTSSELDSLIELQNCLMNLNDTNIDEIKSTLINSEWILTPKSIKQLAANCVLTIQYRPKQVETMAILLSLLLNSQERPNSPNSSPPDSKSNPKQNNLSANSDSDKLQYFVSQMPKFLISAIFRGLYYNKPFPSESAHLSFLYCCFKRNVLSILEIIHQIKLFIKKSVKHSRSLCWIFCYFAPEIEAADPLVYNCLLGILNKASKRNHFPNVFREFYNNFEQLKKNNWTVFNTRRNELSHKCTLIAKIRNDDVDFFRELLKSPKISVDKRIYPTLYAASPMLQSHPTLIHVAAFFGSVKTFKFFLFHHADLFARDNKLVSLPEFAVAGGNIEIIRLCQMNGLDFSSSLHYAALYHRYDILEWLHEEMYPELKLSGTDRSGMTVLHRATQSCFLAGMKLCLHTSYDLSEISEYKKSGFDFLDPNTSILADTVDINSTSFNGWTPIRMAVRYGNLDAARYLIAHRNTIDVNVRTRSGNAPIHFACKYGDLEILMILLQICHVDINIRTRQKMRPIHFAVFNGHLNLVSYLLTFENLLLNVKDKNKTTPLHNAIKFDMTAIAKILINDPRILINFKAKKNHVPLSLCLKYRHYSIFKHILTRRDLKFDFLKEEGQNYLHLLARYNQDKFLKALHDTGKININVKDSKGMTPLHYACSYNAIETVELLISFPETNVNAHDNSKKIAPIHVAVMHGYIEIIYLLCSREDLNINTKMFDGKTPLHVACLFNRKDSVSALFIRNDIDINAVNPKQATPLHIATYCGFSDIISLLLTHPQINRNAQLANGHTAVDIAKTRKDQNIIGLLMTSSAR